MIVLWILLFTFGGIGAMAVQDLRFTTASLAMPNESSSLKPSVEADEVDFRGARPSVMVWEISPNWTSFPTSPNAETPFTPPSRAQAGFLGSRGSTARYDGEHLSLRSFYTIENTTGGTLHVFPTVYEGLENLEPQGHDPEHQYPDSWTLVHYAGYDHAVYKVADKFSPRDIYYYSPTLIVKPNSSVMYTNGQGFSLIVEMWTLEYRELVAVSVKESLNPAEKPVIRMLPIRFIKVTGSGFQGISLSDKWTSYKGQPSQFEIRFKCETSITCQEHVEQINAYPGRFIHDYDMKLHLNNDPTKQKVDMEDHFKVPPDPVTSTEPLTPSTTSYSVRIEDCAHFLPATTTCLCPVARTTEATSTQVPTLSTTSALPTTTTSIPDSFLTSFECHGLKLAVSLDRKTYANAARYCKSVGKHLAVLDSQAVHECVKAQLHKLELQWTFLWIGLTRIGTENGDFMWADGQLLSPGLFTHWRTHSPDNIGGSEYCTHVDFPGMDFTWNDESCNSALGFICQF